MNDQPVVEFSDVRKVPSVTRNTYFETVIVHCRNQPNKAKSARIDRYKEDRSARGWIVTDPYIIYYRDVVIAQGVTLDAAKDAAIAYLTT